MMLNKQDKSITKLIVSAAITHFKTIKQKPGFQDGSPNLEKILKQNKVEVVL